MYADFYGLSAYPFQLTPDSVFFFESEIHTEALARLEYGLQQGKGFIIITGEVGAGKTTLVERLCCSLDPHLYSIVKISSTQTTANEMLRMIVAGFGVEGEGLAERDLLESFQSALLTNFRAGRRTLLVVDEAQNLTVSALEQLQRLSNVMVENKVAMQSFLLGQPQLRPTLAMPEMAQLRRHVLASYHLGALGPNETYLYITHRLGVVGWQRNPQVTHGAFQQIYNLTQGIPRKINTLCSRLLLCGFLEGAHVIDAAIVCRVADELCMEIGDMWDLTLAPQTDIPLMAFTNRLARPDVAPTYIDPIFSY